METERDQIDASDSPNVPLSEVEKSKDPTLNDTKDEVDLINKNEPGSIINKS